MKAVALGPVLLVACAVAARPLDVFPWHLSGDAFVAQVSGQPGVDKWHQSPQATYEQRYAEGYQAGVVDASQGRLWCAPPRHETVGSRRPDLGRTARACRKHAGQCGR